MRLMLLEVRGSRPDLISGVATVFPGGQAPKIFWISSGVSITALWQCMFCNVGCKHKLQTLYACCLNLPTDINRIFPKGSIFLKPSTSDKKPQLRNWACTKPTWKPCQCTKDSKVWCRIAEKSYCTICLNAKCKLAVLYWPEGIVDGMFGESVLCYSLTTTPYGSHFHNMMNLAMIESLPGQASLHETLLKHVFAM